jgi:hypothetical protein
MAFSATDGGARSYQCAVELCGARLFYTEPLTHVRPTAKRPGLPGAHEQAAKQTRNGTTDQRHKPQTEPNGADRIRRLVGLRSKRSSRPLVRECRVGSHCLLVFLAAAQPSGRRCSLSADGTGPPRSLGLPPMVVCVCLQSGALALFQRTTGWDQAGRCCNAAPTLQFIQYVWLAHTHRRCA